MGSAEAGRKAGVLSSSPCWQKLSTRHEGHVYRSKDSSQGRWIQTPGYKNNNDIPIGTLKSPWGEKGKKQITFTGTVPLPAVPYPHSMEHAQCPPRFLTIEHDRSFKKKKKMMHNALLFIVGSLFYSRIKLKVITLNKTYFALKLSKVLAWIWILKVNSIWIVTLCEVCC